MRPEAIARIEALHAEIQSIVDEEIKEFDVSNPDVNEFWGHVRHTQISIFTYSPKQRKQMEQVSAHFRVPSA